MDDAFHLEAAAHLRNHPLTPMSGLINWDWNPEPMSDYNQPPLYFYFLATITALFGESEVVLHLFQSIFAFFTLFFFGKIIELMGLKNRGTLLILFAFCPGLIVNQNIMTDLPILSLVLGVCYYLLKAKRGNGFRNYLMGSLLFTIGLLIKYSVLPIIIILIFCVLVNKAYKSLLVLLIPILFLSLWSYWNYIEYGGIHILNRSSSIGGMYDEAISIGGCIGAISPFSLLLLADLLIPYVKESKLLIYGILILGIFIPVLYYFSDLQVESVMSYTYVFIASGIVVCLYFTVKTFVKLKEGLVVFMRSDYMIFALFFAGFGSFFLLFAPFIATRHMLLMIPFVFFIGPIDMKIISSKLVVSIVLFSVFYGVVLGISDWKYADYFRKIANEVSIPEDKKVWSAGHWGWQYYIKKRGTNEFRTDSTEVQHGDYYIAPGNISIQRRLGDFSLRKVDKIWEDPDVMTFLSGSNFAGMYNTFPVRPPWVFSKSPIDTIYVYKVDKGVGHVIDKIKSDEKWLEKMRRKSITYNISLDSMLVSEARDVLSDKACKINNE